MSKSGSLPAGSGVLQKDGVTVPSPWNFQTPQPFNLVALGMDYGLRPTVDLDTNFTLGNGDYAVFYPTVDGRVATLFGQSQVSYARNGVHNRFGSGHNITVQTQSPDHFEDGTTSKVFVPGQWAVWEYDTGANTWKVVQQGLSKQAMDALYAAFGAAGGGWSQVPDGLMGLGHPGLPDNVGMAWGTSLEPKGLRVKANKTGNLTSLYVNVGTSNGNWIGAVFDTGQATSGSRTQLWKGPVVASAAGWLKLGGSGLSPALSVLMVAGQWYDFVANNDGATATLKQFANNGLSSKLPNDLWPDTPGGAQARLAFKLAVTGGAGAPDVPAGPIVDASVTPNAKVPGIFGLVT